MSEVNERLQRFNERRERRMKATDSVLQKTKEKFDNTEAKLQQLYKKRDHINKEIEDLERKQTNRLNFFETSQEKKEKN